MANSVDEQAVKDLSRAEIGLWVGSETRKLVFATALLFLTAGSLWAHFALGASFLFPPLFLSWLLIHACGFLSLRFTSLGRLLVAVGVTTLQLYFHTTVTRLEMPYLPMAPLFFMLSTLAMTAFFIGSYRLFAAVWVGGWLSSALWVHNLSENPGAVNKAFAFTCAVNLGFFICFFVTNRFALASIQKKMALVGGRHDYDEQRLHAAKLQTIGEMAAGIAHEINNPLAAINGYSHQIRGELTENVPPSVPLIQAANDRIKFNVDRIIEITKALRSFSRQNTNDVNRPVVLKEVIDDGVVLIRNTFKAKNVELRIENPDESLTVLGNFVQLSQVLVNLLANARDACEDSKVKTVTVGCTAMPEQVSMWVEDTGPGISNENEQNVYKAFFTTKDSQKGTGLGLYIARMIAQRHHGSLHFETLRDKDAHVLGTRFVLTLKRTQAANRRAGDVSGSGQAAA